tara:strand:+ start:1308 stop:2201 length:894 start_codon:yes stop_codon:yes gene_type:complete
VSAEHSGISIQSVSERCGVNPVTLRAWERRYGLIRPARTGQGHRRYSEQDVARIERILGWLDRGLPISQVGAVLDQGGGEVRIEAHWQRALDEALEALDALNSRRLEQLFQRLSAEYGMARVFTSFCDPLMQALHAGGARAGAGALLQSVLRQRLAGPVLSRAPRRRQQGWLMVAVGDPLPMLMQALTGAPRPMWCLENAPAWPALASLMASPRVVGVLWVLGEQPGRRQTARLWPPRVPTSRPLLCAGPALTEGLRTPNWLNRVPGTREQVAGALDAATGSPDIDQGDASETGLVS